MSSFTEPINKTDDIPSLPSQHSAFHYTNGLITKENLSIAIPRSIKLSSATKQLGSNQDWVSSGSNDHFHWLVVLDGHGKGNVLNKLSLLDWNALLIEFKDDVNSMITHINKENLTFNKNTGKKYNHFRDGSTCSIVKIYPEYIECHTIGDSQVGIMINNKDCYFTTNHDSTNMSEIDRLKPEGVITSDTWKHHIINDTDLTMITGKYFHFNHPTKDIVDKLAMSRALGHNIGTIFPISQALETFRIDYTKNDSIIIIAATDGLWDIVYDKELILKKFYHDTNDELYKTNKSTDMPVNNLITHAENMWTQKWNVLYEGDVSISQFPNPDDIGIACISII